jgi:hypothetical protein
MEEMKKAAEAAQSLIDIDKDSDLRTQYKIVYQSFKERPKTMLDVSLETGILRANICRYVADMENKGIIQLLYKTDDEHTKFTAGYYTTDKSLFREKDDKQLKLWEDE